MGCGSGIGLGLMTAAMAILSTGGREMRGSEAPPAWSGAADFAVVPVLGLFGSGARCGTATDGPAVGKGCCTCEDEDGRSGGGREAVSLAAPAS